MAQIVIYVNKPLRIHFTQTDLGHLTRKQKPSVIVIVQITFYSISYLMKHTSIKRCYTAWMGAQANKHKMTSYIRLLASNSRRQREQFWVNSREAATQVAVCRWSVQRLDSIVKNCKLNSCRITKELNIKFNTFFSEECAKQVNPCNFSP